MKRFKKDISSNSMIKLSAETPPAREFQLRNTLRNLQELTTLVEKITPQVFKMFGKIADPGNLNNNYFIDKSKGLVKKPINFDIENPDTYGGYDPDKRLTGQLIDEKMYSSSNFPKSSLVMFGGLTTLMISAKFMLGLESFSFLDGVLLSLPSLLSSAILYKMNTDDLKSVKSLLETSKKIRVTVLKNKDYRENALTDPEVYNSEHYDFNRYITFFELQDLLRNSIEFKTYVPGLENSNVIGYRKDNDVYFFTPETISDLNKIQKTVSVKIARYALLAGIPLVTLAGGLAMKKSNEPPKAAAGTETKSETKSETIPPINFDPSTEGGKKWAKFNKKRKSKLEESTKKRTQQWFNNF